MTQSTECELPRILLITKNDFREERDGGSKRTAAVVRALTDHGFAVDFVAVKPFATSDQARFTVRTISRTIFAVAEVLIACASSRSLSALKWFSARAVAQMVALAEQPEKKYAGSIVEFSQLFMYRRLAPNPVAIDMHNIESELLSNYAASDPSPLRRTLASFEAKRMRAIEGHLLSKFDLTATVSGHDKAHLLELAGSGDRDESKVVVAPNGVSDDCFKFEGPRELTVVFVAHLGWRPNIDAAVWLVNEVWPLVRCEDPQLALQLVGRSPAPEVLALIGPSVTVVPDVESVLPYVGTAAVATAPLLAAGGTRLKILEALAVGTPVVSTSLGALGLEKLEGECMKIADVPEEFAARILELARATHSRTSSRDLVEPYRWHRTMQTFMAKFGELTSAGNADNA